MAKRTHTSVPCNQLHGIIIEQDGKRYLDAGIGVLIELKEDCQERTGSFTSMPISDKGEDTWKHHHEFVDNIRSSFDILSEIINNRQTLSVTLKDQTLIDDYKVNGTFDKGKQMEVSAEGINLKLCINPAYCSPEQIHTLLTGGEIHATCDFKNFSRLKTNIDKGIILTPEGQTEEQEIEVGKTYEGIIINHAAFGIFVSCNGKSGLVHKTKLPSTYTNDFDSGNVNNTYPLNSKINVIILDIRKNGKKEHIDMALPSCANSVASMITDKELELKISRIDEQRQMVFVTWQGMEMFVRWDGDEKIPFKQRVRNKKYKIDDRIRGKVINSGKGIYFSMSDLSVDYGINPGDVVKGRLKGTSLMIVGASGEEYEFMIKDSEGISNNVSLRCKQMEFEVTAECIGKFTHGDPLFSVRSYTTGFAKAHEGKTIKAEVLVTLPDVVVWKYGDITDSIGVNTAAIECKVGDKIDITVNMKAGRPSYSIVKAEESWDDIPDLSVGDRIDCIVLASSGSAQYRIKYKSITGTLGSTSRHAYGNTVTVKVVYFDRTEKRLDCIEECPDMVLANEVKGADLTLAGKASQDRWWVIYEDNLYLMYLENRYPQYVEKFVISGQKALTLDIRPDGEHKLRAIHNYDHSKISELQINEGDTIGAKIEGEIHESMILSFNGIYCTMPKKEIDWNSNIYIDREKYADGKIITAKVVRITENEIRLSHRALIESHWTADALAKGEECSCEVIIVRENGNVVVRTGEFLGIIEKANLSWFHFIETDRYSIGKQLNAKVVEYNHAAMNLKLSAIACTESPWQDAQFVIGDKMRATVIEVHKSCAVVKTDNGLEGSITIEGLTCVPYGDCRLVVRNGETFDAEISAINTNNRWIQFRKADLVTERREVRVGEVIEKAIVAGVFTNNVCFDLGNTWGLLLPAHAGQLVEGYDERMPLSSMFVPGQEMKVKICHVCKENDEVYVTGPDGATYGDIPSGKHEAVIISKEASYFILKFQHEGNDHDAYVTYDKLWSVWSQYEHNIGDRLSLNITGLNMKSWLYKADLRGFESNPWKSKILPGDIYEAKVIGIHVGGEAIVSIGRLSAPLTCMSVLTDTPWIPCPDSSHNLKVGDRIKVVISEFDAANRVLKLIPYPAEYDNKTTVSRVTVTHITKEGLYAQCGTYFCYIPKEELYWCPVETAEGLFDIGDTFEAKLIGYDHISGMLTMSRKRLLAHAEAEAQPGKTINGTVSRILDNALLVHCGTFENIIHINDISWDPAESLDEDFLITSFKPGDTVSAKVKSRHGDDITLSIKETTTNPWEYCHLDGKISSACVVRMSGPMAVICCDTYKMVVSDIPEGLTVNTGDIIAVSFHDLNKEEGTIRCRFINVLPDAFKTEIIQDKTVSCTIVAENEDGLEVTLNGGYKGFIPKEEWSWDDKETYDGTIVGTVTEARVSGIDYSGLTAVLSRRKAMGIPTEHCSLREGAKVIVTVSEVHPKSSQISINVTYPELPFMKGEIPFIETGWSNKDRNVEEYRPGNSIEVYVTNVDYRNLSFTASLRRLQNDTRKLDKIGKGERLEVTVTKFVHQKHQAYVQYEEHEGVLMLDGGYWADVNAYTNFFLPGNRIEAVYAGNTPDRKMKFMLSDKEYAFSWPEDIQIGEDIEVRVLQVLDHCIFVYWNGLVIHIRKDDLTWSPQTFDIQQEVIKGGLMRMKITNYDVGGRKIKLSRKVLLPTPKELLSELAAGDRIPMTIRSFAEGRILGEYNGITCIMDRADSDPLIRTEYRDGMPMDVEITGIDNKTLKVGLTSEYIGQYPEFIEGYGYWGEVVSIEGNLLHLDIGGYQAEADIKPSSLNGLHIEDRYHTGTEYWFSIESIDTERNLLVMTNTRTETGSHWYDLKDVGTELYGEVIQVSVNNIHVFAKGLYFTFKKDEISMFDLPVAGIMYSVHDRIPLRITSKNPLTVLPSDGFQDMNTLDITVGDLVEGDIVYVNSSKKTVYLKDNRGYVYTMNLGDYFRQPDTMMHFYHPGKHVDGISIKEIDLTGRQILVSPQDAEDMTKHIYDDIKDGDLLTATVVKKENKGHYILKAGEWFIMLNNTEIPEGTAYEEGEQVVVRIISINESQNSACGSVTKVKKDPLTHLMPHMTVVVDYISRIDPANGRYRVKVNRSFETVCVTDTGTDIKTGTKETVHIRKIDYINRELHLTGKEPAEKKPVSGEVFSCKILAHNDSMHQYSVEFRKGYIAYSGTIDDDQMPWHCFPTPFLLGKFFKAAVLSMSGPDTYSLSCRVLGADLQRYCRAGDNVWATVVGYAKHLGYIISVGSSLGIVNFKELMWQVCDLKNMLWSAGEKIQVKYLRADEHGILHFSYKALHENPFLTHTVSTGERYRATVKRCRLFSEGPQLVVELDYTGGIEAIVKQSSITDSFTHGTELQLPDIGSKIKQVEVKEVQTVKTQTETLKRIVVTILSIS